jgi:hypothetical protein
VGMACRTTTIVCEECQELYDVVTSETPWEGAPDIGEEALVCPGPESADDGEESPNPGHRVRRWTYPGPCPKCGKTISQGEMVVMWD